MKGLLYKDFIYLKKYFFSVGSIFAMTIFTVICVTFFTCAVSGHTVENAYSSMYFMVLGVILIFITANSLSTSLFVLDEKYLPGIPSSIVRLSATDGIKEIRAGGGNLKL